MYSHFGCEFRLPYSGVAGAAQATPQLQHVFPLFHGLIVLEFIQIQYGSRSAGSNIVEPTFVIKMRHLGDELPNKNHKPINALLVPVTGPGLDHHKISIRRMLTRF